MADFENSEDPIEYQIFNLSFTHVGAIAYFVNNLPTESVGIPSGNTGLHEFYLAITDFFRRTGLDPIEPIAFLSWLDTETEICQALGGSIVAKNFIDHIIELKPSTPEAVTKVLIDKYNTRRQLEAIEELKRVVSRKDIKTKEDSQRLSDLTEQIKFLGNSLQYNPYDSLETGHNLAVRTNSIWDLPNFLSTPFEDLNYALSYNADGGLLKGSVNAIIAKSGAGKGHPLDTDIITTKGLKKWGKLLVGDQVFGRNGKPTPVVAIYDRGVLPTYRINFSDRTSALVDGDHIWTVQYVYGHVGSWNNEKTITTEELSYTQLQRKRDGSFIYRIPIVAPIDFPQSDLPIEPYTLGALLSNGNLTANSARLTTPDKDVAGRVACSYKVHLNAKADETICDSYNIHGLIGIAREMKITVKSAHKFIPEEYFFSSIDQRIALLQGLMDGDGSSRAKSGRRSARYFTTSAQLQADIIRLVNSLGGTAVPNVFTRKRNGRIEIDYSVSIMLPENIPPFFSSHKSIEPKRTHKYIPYRAIVSVERVQDSPIRCISVEAADNLYAVGRECIVTHNSTLARCFMKHWLETNHKILFVNYEEAASHWERTLYTQITHQNPYKKEISEEIKTKSNVIYQETLEQWGKNFMIRHDPETPYFDDLERWLYDLIGYNGAAPDAIIIDTIQSMFVKGSGNKPRWGQFEEIMVRLEKLAKDLDTAVIITSQENSNRMKEKRDVVQQSDAGGSLTIIQKCSIAIFIVQKKEADNDDTASELVMELQIPKNRITGGAFAQRPPLVIYNDDLKSFLPYKPEITQNNDFIYQNWKV